MGTQQILLIVLSVIIVGIAVAVGITMFNQQAKNQNRNSCISDMNNFAAQAMAWFKTPTSHGGAGNDLGTGTTAEILTEIGIWIGFNFDGTATYSTDNGSYVSSLTGTTSITWQATGTEFGVDPRLVMAWSDGTKDMTLDVDGTQ